MDVTVIPSLSLQIIDDERDLGEAGTLNLELTEEWTVLTALNAKVLAERDVLRARNPMANPQLNEKLLALKNRYVLMVPDRIAAISSTLAGWMNGGSETTERLERQFHTLAGTAGSYALMNTAAAASEGEETCIELHHSPLERDDFIYLSFLVGHLQHALTADMRP